MNNDLSNNLFKNYFTYITIIYSALNKKSLNSCSKHRLYRGETISRKEFEEIEKNFNKKKNNENKNNEINISLLYSKQFLSFSKSEKDMMHYYWNTEMFLLPL